MHRILFVKENAEIVVIRDSSVTPIKGHRVDVFSLPNPDTIIDVVLFPSKERLEILINGQDHQGQIKNIDILVTIA